MFTACQAHPSAWNTGPLTLTMNLGQARILELREEPTSRSHSPNVKLGFGPGLSGWCPKKAMVISRKEEALTGFQCQDGGAAVGLF